MFSIYLFTSTEFFNSHFSTLSPASSSSSLSRSFSSRFPRWCPVMWEFTILFFRSLIFISSENQKSFFTHFNWHTATGVEREWLANGRNGRHDNNIEFEPAASTAAEQGTVELYFSAPHNTWQSIFSARISHFSCRYTLHSTAHTSPASPATVNVFLRLHSSSPCVSS